MEAAVLNLTESQESHAKSYVVHTSQSYIKIVQNAMLYELGLTRYRVSHFEMDFMNWL